MQGGISTITAKVMAAGARAVSAPALADVAACARAYVPHFKGLSPAQARDGVDVMRSALADLDSFVVVNRRERSIRTVLGSSSAAFPTVHTSAPDSTFAPMRRSVEQAAGVYGSGSLAGRTVFGSVQFRERGVPFDAAPFRAQWLGEAQYGAYAVVLKPSVLARTTFTAGDGVVMRAGEVAGPQQLPSVALELLVRAAELDKPGAAAALRAIESRAPDAVGAVKRYLVNRGKGQDFIEAHVRGAAADDIAGIYVERLWNPPRETVDSLARLAASRGIAFHP